MSRRLTCLSMELPFSRNKKSKLVVKTNGLATIGFHKVSGHVSVPDSLDPRPSLRGLLPFNHARLHSSGEDVGSRRMHESGANDRAGLRSVIALRPGWAGSCCRSR